MKLENKTPAEGINASSKAVYNESMLLIGGVVVALISLVLLICLSAGWIAPRIPYRYEARLAEKFNVTAPAKDAKLWAAQQALQDLANRLATRMQLPDGMQVRVGVRDEGTINAFATLGGQTVFFRGLLLHLNSEDAVAAVLAHEMAHLKYRHPVEALGRGIGLGVLLSVLSADLGQGVSSNALSQLGLTTALSFNRKQERAADEEALRVLAAEYGHIGGAIDLFNTFLKLPDHAPSTSPHSELLSSHPLITDRLSSARHWAETNKVQLIGERRPLPAALAVFRTESAPAAILPFVNPPGQQNDLNDAAEK